MNNEDTKEFAVSTARSEIIEASISLEGLIDTIICQRYLGRLDMTFLFEVLYDEYCSFGFKRRILEKIFKEQSLDQKYVHKIGRLNCIRNYFAHRGPTMAGATKAPSGRFKPFVPDPRDLTRDIDFPALYKEFKKTMPEVAKYLLFVLGKLGARLTRAK